MRKKNRQLKFIFLGIAVCLLGIVFSWRSFEVSKEKEFKIHPNSMSRALMNAGHKKIKKSNAPLDNTQSVERQISWDEFDQWFHEKYGTQGKLRRNANTLTISNLKIKDKMTSVTEAERFVKELALQMGIKHFDASSRFEKQGLFNVFSSRQLYKGHKVFDSAIRLSGTIKKGDLVYINSNLKQVDEIQPLNQLSLSDAKDLVSTFFKTEGTYKAKIKSHYPEMQVWANSSPNQFAWVFSVLVSDESNNLASYQVVVGEQSKSVLLARPVSRR